jgi:hypothetical protein
MSLNLPEPIAAYFVADGSDNTAISQCFTDNAVVKDEGHTYTGLSAIQNWKQESAKKYTYTSEPIAYEKNDKNIVTTRVTGNFPGSPIDLRFFFSLEGNKIASLEIAQ